MKTLRKRNKTISTEVERKNPIIVFALKSLAKIDTAEDTFRSYSALFSAIMLAMFPFVYHLAKEGYVVISFTLYILSAIPFTWYFIVCNIVMLLNLDLYKKIHSDMYSIPEKDDEVK